MRLLLDTHFLIWLATDTDKVRPVERLLLSDSHNDIHLSVVSLWEIRIKWQTLDRDGRPKGALSPEKASVFAVRNSFKLAPLQPNDVTTALDPPIAQRDPFDEMLLAHAQQLGAKLLTRDRLLLDHPLVLQL